MSNRITIELCEEDRKRLDGLFLMAAEIVNELKNRGVPVCKELESLKPAAPEAEHPVDAVSPHGLPEPAAEPEPVVEPELPQYSKADVLALVQRLAAPNSPNREQAKAIVKSYGSKVSDIPEDKYDEVMAKLAELEG